MQTQQHAVALDDMLMYADDDGKCAVRARGRRNRSHGLQVDIGRFIPCVVTSSTTPSVGSALKRFTSSTSLPLLDNSARTASSLGSLGSSSSSSHNDEEYRRPEEVPAPSKKRRRVLRSAAISTKGRILGDFTAPVVTVSPAEDETFAGSIVSPLSYTEVRKTWNRPDELKKRLEGKSLLFIRTVPPVSPLSCIVVRLPYDFNGQYAPASVEEMKELARLLIGDSVTAPTEPGSDYAIVCICVEMDICSLADENHRAYGEQHGYDYIYLNAHVPGVPPKMLKFLLLTWALDQGYEWLLMLDGKPEKLIAKTIQCALPFLTYSVADAFITNSKITLEGIISSQLPKDARAGDISLIMSRGGNWKELHALNNGIFFLRNTDWTYKHMLDIFTVKYSYTRFLCKSLIDQPVQISILIAQKQISFPPQEEYEVGPNIVVTKKRLFNSFRREDSHSSDDASEDGVWKKGDFIAHFATKDKFAEIFRLYIELGLELPPVSDRYGYSIPAQGDSEFQETRSGTCWCDDAHNQVKCLPRLHIIGPGDRGRVMQYLSQNPGVHNSPHINDKAGWLTGEYTTAEVRQCTEKKKLSLASTSVYAGAPEPIFVLNTGEDMERNVLVPPEGTICDHGTMVDDLAIWNSSSSNNRGTSIPELLNLIQPTSSLVVVVGDLTDWVYKKYNEPKFEGTFASKTPQDFNELMKRATALWWDKGCTTSNFSTCLPADLVEPGKWLARTMHGERLMSWLDLYTCSRLQIFDTSDADVFRQVSSLYTFAGVSDNQAAHSASLIRDDLPPTVQEQMLDETRITFGEICPEIKSSNL
ncbi:hypothetical protein THAOC_33066 [Thalassiosira oceanica]|uniref:Uncharacterized protein n=1 Tax=Thalassiosira oceanica TaxID=159749 RepID=K0RN48_THAOC|nr:hypothetical protein THAOC_33066 [Thalassiosira oceanica]|eukprot:EJK48167.1 hypothetical protein THAOC_33066 [Thalassiosira oceanica]